MIVKQVYEYSYLYVDGKTFTQDHFDKLVLYNETNKNIYFDVGYQKVKFKQYVGVIQIDDLTIEILPKTDKFDNKEKWKKVLIEMLQICGYIRIKSFDNANLDIRYASLIELYFDTFLTETEEIIHQGLTKKYRTKSKNLFSLKGRLSFNEHITKNAVHKERFYTTHQVYDKNNQLNQVIKKTLKIIRGLSHNYQYKKRCNKLLLEFEQVSNKNFIESSFDNITYNRKTEHYKSAINLARLIILNYSPNISSGIENVLGLLFDMNRLFETYVLVKLQEACDKNDIIQNIEGQGSKTFWKNKTIRPDIIIELINGEKIILDTKWKNRQNGYPDDGDLKQMYVYNIHFGARKSLLVYPRTNQKNTKPQMFELSEGIKEAFIAHTCSMYFIDLFDDNQQLNTNLGEMMLNTITSNLSLLDS